jgi:hypothetical protein
MGALLKGTGNGFKPAVRGEAVAMIEEQETDEQDAVADEQSGSGGADSPEEVVGDEDVPAATPEEAEENLDQPPSEG